MKLSRVLIALAILTALTLLIHRYLWARLVRDPQWSSTWSRSLTVSIFTLAVLIPFSFWAIRGLPRSFNSPLSWVVYTWMGLMVYLFFLTVLSDAGRGMASLVGALPQDPERRQFVTRSIAASIGTVSLLIGIGGFFNAVRGFKVRRIRVPLEKLPQSASGYSIVQLTDVHVGPTIGRDFIESIVRETNALEPDLIAITGDLMDGSVEQLRDLVEPLRNLKAKDGIFFVTGNHEYYSGADEWIAYLGTLGIRVLRNERVDIRGAFDLAGVDDFSAAGMLPHHGMDIPKATAGRDTSRPLVLLAHQPRALKQAMEAGVDLQISGHVHGGQMIPFNWLAHIDQPVIHGHHQFEKTWIYVSSGTGYWGPPMRVGTTAEITRIELVGVAS